MFIKFMTKKKLIYFSLIIFLIFSLLFLFQYASSSLGNKDNILAQNLKKLLPLEIKNFLKEKVFIVKNLRNEVEFQKKLVQEKEEEINEILNEVLINQKIDIPFRKIYDKNFKLNSKLNINLKKFKTKLLVHGKWHRAKGTSYLSIGEDMLFLVSGDGYFAYEKLDLFQNDSIKMKIINSNIRELIKQEEFYKSSLYGIKSVLYHNNKIYISLTYERKDNCFNTSVFSAEFNFTKLNFNKFFVPEECVYKRKKDFQPAQSGGKMLISDNKMILTIGDWRYRSLAQKKESIFGKIIEINLDNNNYKILSMGHRNPQGLALNQDHNILINTEHGPKGGDEINFNKNFSLEINNFGWPISSYGEHYGFEERDDNHQMYKKFPLYKSHSEHGFKEPIKYYVPSIAISQIIEIDTEDKENFLFIVGALGDTPEIGQMSLHLLKINKKNFQVKDENILNINERVRDMVYDKKNKKVYLFFETTASIGIMDLG